MRNLTWAKDIRHPKYEMLVGYQDAMVRIEPTPSGRYLWQFRSVYDYADTIDEAKEMVEGLAIIEH